MSQDPSFDFFYALEHTRVLQLPTRQLETFGTTSIHYHLLTEALDSVDQVRVREGTLKAAKPQILTPQHMLENQMEGFQDEESRRFMSWLRETHPNLRLLQYGFTIEKQDVQDTLLTESMEVVAGNVLEAVKDQSASSAVLMGVEQPWEVCLLKLMADLVEQSMPNQIQQLQQRNLLPNPGLAGQEIEAAFASAEQDPERIPYLQKVLKRHGMFEQMQDRFFATVRRSRG